MSGQRVRQISIWVIAVFFILGCVTPFFASTPTQPAQPLDNLETIIVQTADAAQTLTATFLPASTHTGIPAPALLPTQTLAPTQTPLILISQTPTSTPGFLIVGTDGTLVSVTPAAVSSPVSTSFGGKPTSTAEVNGGAVIKTPKPWNCKIVEKSPVNGSVIKQGLHFYAYWTVMNSGTEAWQNYDIDFVFINGLDSELRPVQDLPHTVAAGGKITLKVPLTAPRNIDVYNVLWSLRVGSTYFCPMRVTFNVE